MRTFPVFAASLLVFACAAHGALKVDISPNNGRNDVLTPHWENWRVAEGTSASQKFGEITATLRTAKSGPSLTTPFFLRGGCRLSY